jgi:hypothetical protein
VVVKFGAKEKAQAFSRLEPLRIPAILRGLFQTLCAAGRMYLCESSKT